VGAAVGKSSLPGALLDWDEQNQTPNLTQIEEEVLELGDGLGRQWQRLS